MAVLDATEPLNRIYTLLSNGSSITIYQPGDTIPEPQPNQFWVLQPLFSTMRQEWAVRKDVTQQIQILCVATGRGTVREMTECINQLLPAAEFTITGTGWQNHNGTHFEIPVTITTVT